MSGSAAGGNAGLSMRALALLYLAILCSLSGCGASQLKLNTVVLSYSVHAGACVDCASFVVDFSEGGNVHYKCTGGCAVPGEQNYIVPGQRFRDMVKAFQAAKFFSIPRTGRTRVSLDVPLMCLTYRDGQRIHEVVDIDRHDSRITELENRMVAATDVQRYLKPSVTLYRGLADSGWDVNTLGSDQQNALFSAEVFSDVESVRFLLQRGSRVTDQTLEFAAAGGNVGVFHDLLAAYGKLKGGLAAKLLVRAAEGESSTETLRFLLDSGWGVNPRDSEEEVTPLFGAVRSGSLENVRLLLTKGADANARDRSGRTPLWYAATGLNTGPIALLLQYGANVNAQDYEGTTPLMQASNMCYTWDIRTLLDAGADPRIIDKGGRTALQPDVTVVGDPKCGEARNMLQEALISSR